MKDFDILVLGSNGLLGSYIVKDLKKRNLNFFTIARSNSNYNFNFKNFKNLNIFFLKHKFKIVINCIAKTNIDYCNKKFNEANIINYKMVEYLSKMSKKFGFKLVQISTDQVYEGKKFKLNNEKSKICAVNGYAKSKILAEKSVKKLKKFLIIRTNFTGKKKNTFLDFLFKSFKSKKTFNLFDDMYISTLDVETCAKIIIDLSLMESRGIYNVGTKDMVSKKNFALQMSKTLKLKINYRNVSCETLTVPRGKNLGLNVKKIEQKLGYSMPTIQQSIRSLAKYY